MKKRSLVLLLCLALVALVAVNDTLANTAVGLFNQLTDLLGVEFGVPPPGGEALQVDVVSGSVGVLTPSHYEGEFPGVDAVSGAVTNTTYAQNSESEAAFVRLCIYVKKDKVLRHGEPVYNTADYDCFKNDELAGYTLYTFDYKRTLAAVDNAGSQSSPITMKVALVRETTNEDLARLGDQFIKVQSFAIAADAFSQLNNAGEKITDQSTDKTPMPPTTALQCALGPINTFNPFN